MSDIVISSLELLKFNCFKFYKNAYNLYKTSNIFYITAIIEYRY